MITPRLYTSPSGLHLPVIITCTQGGHRTSHAQKPRDPFMPTSGACHLRVPGAFGLGFAAGSLEVPDPGTDGATDELLAATVFRALARPKSDSFTRNSSSATYICAHSTYTD